MGLSSRNPTLKSSNMTLTHPHTTLQPPPPGTPTTREKETGYPALQTASKLPKPTLCIHAASSQHLFQVCYLEVYLFSNFFLYFSVFFSIHPALGLHPALSYHSTPYTRISFISWGGSSKFGY